MRFLRGRSPHRRVGCGRAKGHDGQKSRWEQLGLCALAIALGLSTARCGGEAADAMSQGQIQIRVEALTAVGDVARVVANIQPAGVNQELGYDPATGSFVGTLVVEPGSQTVFLTPFDKTGNPIGEGSATATVTQGATAALDITVLDTSGGIPDVDLGPVVATLVASKTQTQVGETIELFATAVDKNGDPISYTWSDTCTTTTFGTLTASTTTWSNAQPGSCLVTIRVEANGLSYEKSVSIATVALGSGTIDVTGRYVPHPRISNISAYDFANLQGFTCSIHSGALNGTCPNSVRPGHNVEVSSITDFGPGIQGSKVWLDDCNGTVSEEPHRTTWTAPLTPSVCKLTLQASNQGMVTELSMAIVVDGPVVEARLLKGDITQNTTLDAHPSYAFDGTITVKAGAKLTIPAGTTLFAVTDTKPSDDPTKKIGAIVVETGGMIDILGTPDAPVVMTAQQRLVDRKWVGSWKGLEINGDPADPVGSSGTVQYLRVEYGGFFGLSETSCYNDPNAGIRLIEVGSGTAMHHVQSFASRTHGFVVSGGAPHIRYAISTRSRNGGYRITESSRVTGQHWIADAFTRYPSFCGGIIILSAHPTLANVSLLGDPGTGRPSERLGMNIDNYTQDYIGMSTFQIHNTIIAEFEGGVAYDTGRVPYPGGGWTSNKEIRDGVSFSHSYFYSGGYQLANAAQTFSKAEYNNTLGVPIPGVAGSSYVPTTVETSAFDPATLGSQFESAPYVGAVGTHDWTQEGVVFKNGDGSIR